MNRFAAWVILCVALSGSSVWAEAPFMQGKRYVVDDYSSGKVCVIEADGSISRSYPAPDCNDVWILPDEHILFTTGHGAREVDGAGKTVFEYKSTSEIYATQRLPNGNTFIGECLTGRLLEVAPDGTNIVKAINILHGRKGEHGFIRNARVLANGHYLVAHYVGRHATEYDEAGQIVWDYEAPSGVHSVTRLSNGNTVIACADNGRPCIQIVTPDKKVAWEFSNSDLTGDPLKFMTGFQLLPNGHYLFTNWLGHGKFGQAPHIYEVTPEKKVVWTMSDFKNFKTVSSIQVFLPGITTNAVH